MSREECSPDNARCEGFFGHLKTELFYPRDWKSTTIEQFIEEIDSYILKTDSTNLQSVRPMEGRLRCQRLGTTRK